MPEGGQGPIKPTCLALFNPSVPGIEFSAILVVEGGMFQTTQWSNVPLASGSSTTSAIPFDSLGVPSIVKGGLVPMAVATVPFGDWAIG